MIECKHKIDEKTIRYDKRYGRIGKCKLCGREVYAVRISHNPKRERVKMKKKERRKFNKEIRNVEGREC